MKTFLFYREFLFFKSNASLSLLTCSFSIFLSLFYFWCTDETQDPALTKNLLTLFSLFGVFLTTDQLFKEDIECGSLEILSLQNVSFFLLSLSRYCTYYLLVIFPLGFLNLVLLQLFTRNSLDFFYLGTFLLLFIPYSLIASMAAVFTHGAEKQKGLSFLICLPFFVPFILTQQSLFSTVEDSSTVKESLQLLLGLLLFFVPLTFISFVYGLKFTLRIK